MSALWQRTISARRAHGQRQTALLAAAPVSAAAALIRKPKVTPNNSRNRFLPPMQSAAVYAAWSASSACRAKPSAAGCKKRGGAPALEQHLGGASAPTKQPWRWNSMNSGRSSARKAASVGFGLRCSRQTRQVVAFVVGDRSEATCRRLWAPVPVAYQQDHCYSDF